MRQRQEALTRLHYCATMFTSDKAKIVKYDLNISFKLNALIMNKPMSKKQLDPYFFTLKQTATYLNTSTSTYSRREREGGAPRGHYDDSLLIDQRRELMEWWTAELVRKGLKI